MNKHQHYFQLGFHCCLVFCLVTLANSKGQENQKSIQAGAVILDVTPETLPAIANGGMLSRKVDKVTTPLKARGIALSDGKSKLVILVVDSCMMPRLLLDQVKVQAAKQTGIPAERILISATHSHSAGSCMGLLGTEPDPNYVPFLKKKLIEAIAAADKNLQPARIGFASANAPDYTALRRWIRRPDRIIEDPFGNLTVRAQMHAGRKWEDVTGESGPEDPQLTLISIQTMDQKPLAVLANFSMHYFGGDQGISADYFGLFCEGLKKKIAPDSDQFVGIMSHGCSGDIWRRDYTRPESWEVLAKMDDYANGLVGIAAEALEKVDYEDQLDLSMAEQRMTLRYRLPDKQRLEWAQRIVEAMGDRLPKNQEEVYAKEQIILHERQETEVVTQAIRIGDIGIATTPNETYAITGLKIKAASPLPKTMVIELANGGDGYIPPPEQHLFGGYNTWAARSAGLEVMAEPKIAESCRILLEKVAEQPRRHPIQTKGSAASVIEQIRPRAWYRLDEFNGPRAVDSTGSHHDGIYESHLTYYLEGPDSRKFCHSGETNRAAMFVGGRLRTRYPEPGKNWSVSMWIWNGMPNDGREVSGWFLSRGNNHGLSKNSIHLGIGGTSGNPGKIILRYGDDPRNAGTGQTEVPRWQWQHVAYVKKGRVVQVYLNGTEEFECPAESETPAKFDDLFFGGRSDNQSNWEGRLDEIAVFDRALTKEEVAQLSGSE